MVLAHAHHRVVAALHELHRHAQERLYVSACAGSGQQHAQWAMCRVRTVRGRVVSDGGWHPLIRIHRLERLLTLGPLRWVGISQMIALLLLVALLSVAEGGVPHARHLLQLSPCALCCGAVDDRGNTSSSATQADYCATAFKGTPGVCCGTVRDVPTAVGPVPKTPPPSTQSKPQREEERVGGAVSGDAPTCWCTAPIAVMLCIACHREGTPQPASEPTR